MSSLATPLHIEQDPEDPGQMARTCPDSGLHPEHALEPFTCSSSEATPPSEAGDLWLLEPRLGLAGNLGGVFNCFYMFLCLGNPQGNPH